MASSRHCTIWMERHEKCQLQVKNTQQCTHTHACTYVLTHTHICMYICTHTHTHMHVQMYTHTHACAHAHKQMVQQTYCVELHGCFLQMGIVRMAIWGDWHQMVNQFVIIPYSWNGQTQERLQCVTFCTTYLLNEIDKYGICCLPLLEVPTNVIHIRSTHTQWDHKTTVLHSLYTHNTLHTNAYLTALGYFW